MKRSRTGNKERRAGGQSNYLVMQARRGPESVVNCSSAVKSVGFRPAIESEIEIAA